MQGASESYFFAYSSLYPQQKSGYLARDDKSREIRLTKYTIWWLVSSKVNVN